MIFTFFIIIVFIAELIIALTLILGLVKFDRYILKTNDLLTEAKPKIKDIAELTRGISEQIAELTPIWVHKVRDAGQKFVLKQLEGIVSGAIFWGINLKIMKRLKRTKFVKAVWKGFTLIQNVI